MSLLRQSKRCRLTNGQTFEYDTVRKIEEKHPTKRDVTVSLYHFSKRGIGIFKIVPTREVAQVEV